MTVTIPTWTPKEVEAVRRSCAVAAKILRDVAATVQPGVTTLHLDRLAAARLEAMGVQSAFLGEDGFPAVLCCSVNHVAVHGAPTETPLREGDLLSIDFGVILDGWYSDVAVTVSVGKASPEALRLLKVTREALERGIAKAKPGNYVGDISSTIQRHVETAGFQVIRELAGHGVGRSLHEPPQLPNHGKAGSGIKLVSGMVIAIEPITAVSTQHVRRVKDGYAYETTDGSLSAHFEHTVAVTQSGPDILTLS